MYSTNNEERGTKLLIKLYSAALMIQEAYREFRRELNAPVHTFGGDPFENPN